MKTNAKLIGILILSLFVTTLIALVICGDKGNDFKEWEKQQKAIELYNSPKLHINK